MARTAFLIPFSSGPSLGSRVHAVKNQLDCSRSVQAHGIKKIGDLRRDLNERNRRQNLQLCCESVPINLLFQEAEIINSGNV